MQSVSEGMSVREECEGGRSVNERMSERGVKWGRVRGGGEWDASN